MIGSPRVHYRVTDSTNERARELADQGALHGTLVTADEQESGRGRQGRVWSAPPGTAVLMSLILRDLDERHALLPLVAAVAVCEAC
jgi:BirA family transcriptional regulator, biotin operon repressor / biotin---[acetyl-CoA-carboxylase] ligase